VTQQRFGNYRVVRQLGEGGMGVVFEALHEEIGKRAAIKVLHTAYSKDPQISARFLTEARAVNLVQHPGLVSIFEFGRTPDGAAFLVMEFLEGETLRERVHRLGRLAVADARRIARQIAGALAAAHEKNVVHRDLKPENVMLIPEPELPGGERAKVLDFGVAKVAQGSAAGATQAGAFLGTPAYMAPEQCLSAASVDDKADVYALGVMLYETHHGAFPVENAAV
jgi:serine/threonine protein kinase